MRLGSIEIRCNNLYHLYSLTLFSILNVCNDFRGKGNAKAAYERLPLTRINSISYADFRRTQTMKPQHT